ncbi:MAG TPA: flagellar biosynthetic protein FliR [Verrucomicrobiae bacterium]|nr:flagellar biosynthetic protein FliR [Verrucomicrobiae bacterium]
MTWSEPIVWMLVFARITALLAILPMFSAAYLPVQLRTALGALLAFFTASALPPVNLAGMGVGSLVGLFAMEICVGLLLGFVGRMLFYALDVAGNIMATQIGLMMTQEFNPLAAAREQAPGAILNFLAITLFMSLDMHHWLLIGFQRTYDLLPIGAARLTGALFTATIAKSTWMFVAAIQIAAPLIAVSFVISLVFSVLGRAVPQMNVFGESFAFRILGGLAVFGLTLNLMAQHISNYLHQLPEDILRVAQLLSGK